MSQNIEDVHRVLRVLFDTYLVVGFDKEGNDTSEYFSGGLLLGGKVHAPDETELEQYVKAKLKAYQYVLELLHFPTRKGESDMDTRMPDMLKWKRRTSLRLDAIEAALNAISAPLMSMPEKEPEAPTSDEAGKGPEKGDAEG